MKAAAAARNTAWAGIALAPLFGTISINLLTILLLACAAAVLLARPPGEAIASLRAIMARNPALALALGLLAGYALLSVFTGLADGRPRSLRELAAPLVLIAAGAVVLAPSAREGGAGEPSALLRLKHLIEAAFVLSAVIIAIQAVADFPVQRLLHLPMDRWHPKIKSFDRSVIFIAAMLFAYLEVAGAVLARGGPGRPREAARAATAAACALAIVMLMANQTAKVAALCGLLAYAGARWSGLRLRLSSVVAAILAYACALPLLLGKLTEVCAAHPEQVRESFLYRCYIWNYSTELIASRPLLGLGFDGARYVTQAFERPWPATLPDAAQFPFTLHPHNNFLQIWLELGAVGILLIVAIGVIWLASRRRDILLTPAELATAVVLFIVANLSFGMWQTNWLSTLVIPTVVLALRRKLAPLPPPLAAGAPAGP